MLDYFSPSTLDASSASRRRTRAAAIAVRLLFVSTSFLLTGRGATADEATIDFERQVRPLLKRYCYECHAERKAEGNLRLDRLTSGEAETQAVAVWREIDARLGGLSTPTMPPKEKPQPTTAERTMIRSWIRSHLAAITAGDAREQQAEGRIAVRRLNRVEYQNTLHDLLGIELDLKPFLPEDESVAGFDNVGSGLQITRIHQECYLEAAAAALDGLFNVGPRPTTTLTKFVFPKDGHPPRRVVEGDTIALFSSYPAELQRFRPTVAGPYRVRISTYAVQNEDRPIVGLFALGNPVDPVEKYVSIPSGKPTIVELNAYLTSKNTFQITPYGLGRKYIRDLANWPEPGLAVEWVEAEGPLVDAWPPENYRRIFGDLDLKKATPAEAERILADFLPRAFRRPVPEEKREPYLAFFRRCVEADPKNVADALRQSLTAVLCSPDFLMLHEAPGPLDDYALAARLSYFFWRAPPDETLLDLASRNQLRRPEELRRQVDRMLADPKASAFAEHFLGQWLSLRRIDATTPDRMLYPEFDDYLEYSMLREPQLFFEEMLRNDLPLERLIDADFSILNDRLAAHYGIAGVEGPAFRKVTLPPDCHRGGVLTMAAVLKVTANGTVTSPVLRGAWLMNNLLGQPVQLPSDLAVPAVEPDIRGALNVRDQLAKHRTSAQCAACHRKIDPAGFALEQFDPIGGFRTHYRALGKRPKADVALYGKPVEYSHGLPVEAGDELPGGKRFRDVDEYKRLLLEDPSGLVRTAVEKLTIYATGGPLRPADAEAMESLLAKVRAKRNGLRSLVYELVQSELFLKK